MTTTVETLDYHTALEISEETGEPVSKIQDDYAIMNRPDQPKAVLDARREREQLAKKMEQLQAQEAAAFVISRRWDELLSIQQTLVSAIALVQQQLKGLTSDVAGQEHYILEIMGNAFEPFPGIINRVGLLEHCRATVRLLARSVEVKTVELEKLNGEIAAFARKHDLCDSLEPPK